KVFLFDEPLSNLDAALRVATRIEIAKLHESMSDVTMIYVTHDQVEAMTLADRIVVLRAGHIEQVGAPMELYHRPDNLFVARFIGSPAMNILAADVTATGDSTTVQVVGGGSVTAPIATTAAMQGARVQLGVRPEDLRPAEADTLFDSAIAIVEALGEVTLAHLDNWQQGGEPIIAKLPGDVKLVRGERRGFTAAPETIHLFDKDGKSLRG
ncbi:MAG TPA: ABC transporter ATP-binding protein, partial [Rhizobiaceae bacterium]|nr:ABC transporter ATP-binding protein [Rhizobiaceae bacterium]